MWYPDHIGERYAQEALASKLVKLRISGGAAYAGALDLHSYDSRPGAALGGLCRRPTG